MKSFPRRWTFLDFWCHLPSTWELLFITPPFFCCCVCRRSGAGHQCKRTETQTLVRVSQKQRQESGVLAYAHAARSPKQWKDGLDCTRSAQACTHAHAHTHTVTHTNRHTYRYTHTHPKVDMRPSKATRANKQQLCNNNNNDITENKIHRVNHRPRYSYMISMLIFSDGKNVCPNELF